MKKLYVALLSLLMCLALCSCGAEQMAEEPLLESVGSEVYTEEEINDAAEVVTENFEANFSGCTLTSLRYPGDQTSAFQEWAEQYDADQAIILVSDFEAGEVGDESALTPNSTCEGWQWILVRNEGSSWEAKTWGYG